MRASIILGVYNDEAYVAAAIQSLLKQTYAEFELIIIDDHSRDRAPEIIAEFKDARIRWSRNHRPLGIVKVRNDGLKLVQGDYVFFADSDCVYDAHWLAAGMRVFEEQQCVGVEGLTYYVKPGYQRSISDKLPGAVECRGHYMCCNVAYSKQILTELKGFNLQCEYHSDREFALRAKRFGAISYCPDMQVTHQQKNWTVRSYAHSARRAISRVIMFQEGLDDEHITLRILNIRNLLKILFPPLILAPLFKYQNKTWLDYQLVLTSYPRLVYERYLIWKTAIEKRVFII